ncbi:MAG TPA: glycosyltransferase family 2 protein [Flexilinea sp.]|jgi:dolichol-phosphate mannosyltransferase|nr:glycosyltransferase family 2 protein [Flexilinea sp.]HOG21050.1 glycosyltransferase family 2 protein [Flexilinea sp.]HOR55203.1 glycosyltransferase family 2 protein [Flexilinea sp.]HOU20135.1 glycosyltransferase family 2 protein [Flexilinea sp.]HPL58296.1 glycosyltransferase family 2 protein [Flexilinea sp.]
MKPTYSVIVPVYNEKESLPVLYERMVSVMDQTGEPWELILVDDGSFDGSSQIMRELSQKDPRVRVIFFARNFGHQIAVTAGMDHALGDAAIVIDADLQDPPEVILELIEKWKEGYEVVYAVRTGREGESWFKKETASVFYRLIYKITDVKIPLDAGDFRLLDRKVLDVMNSMREKHRFLRGMSAWVGYKQIGVPYQRAPRYAGKTKYPLKKMILLAWNAITGFSYVPLQIAMILGFIVAFISILLIIVVIILRINGNELVGQATTLISTLFLGGVQLICLGIIGEYLGRIYDEVKNRPLYIAAEITPSIYDEDSEKPSEQERKE